MQVQANSMGTWPTPTSRDHKSTQASQATHERNARPLSEVVGLHDQASPNTDGKPRDWSTPQAGQVNADSHGERPPETKNKGSLNPAWVSQLLGFPVGWLDLPADDDASS